MIYLTRLNHHLFVVNSDLIEQIEVTPDTVITLTTGQKFMVREAVEQVIERIVEFRRSLLPLPGQPPGQLAGPSADEVRWPPVRSPLGSGQSESAE